MVHTRNGKIRLKIIKYAFFGLALFGLGCTLGFSMWKKCFTRSTFRRVLSEHNTVEILKNISISRTQIPVALARSGVAQTENSSDNDVRTATGRQERRRFDSEPTGQPVVNSPVVVSSSSTALLPPISRKWQSGNNDCLFKSSHVAEDKKRRFKHLPDKYSTVIWPPTARQDCGTGSLLYPWTFNTVDDPWMVFLVKSAPQHFALRNAIRSTWGTISSIENRRFVTIFLLGKPQPGNSIQHMQDALEKENTINGDILQCISAESYKTLPSKVLDSFRWISQLKDANSFFTFTDDDCVMNIQNINTFFSQLQEEQAKNSVFCGFIYDKDCGVIRDVKSKWAMSKDLYSENFYPTYCHGGMYTMKQPLIKSLYCMSEITNKTGFYLEDVLITGILREKIGYGDGNIKPVTTGSGMKYEVMYYPWEGNLDRTLSKMHRKWTKLNQSLSYYHSRGLITTKKFLQKSKENTNITQGT